MFFPVAGPGSDRGPTKAGSFTAAPDKRVTGVAPPSCGPTKTHPLQEEQAARTGGCAKVTRSPAVFGQFGKRRETRDEERFLLHLAPALCVFVFHVYRGQILWTGVAGECIPIAMIKTLGYFCFKSIRNTICVQYALMRGCELYVDGGGSDPKLCRKSILGGSQSSYFL